MRGRSSIEDVGWTNASLHESRIHASKPSDYLLRKRIYYSRTSTIHSIINIYDDMVYKDTCQLIMRCDTCDPHVALAAALTLDACRFTISTNNQVKLKNIQWNRIVAALVIPNLQSKVFHLYYCTPMKNKTDVVYLLSKTLVQRCNTRLFDSVSSSIITKTIESMMKERSSKRKQEPTARMVQTAAKARETCIQVKHIILCGLLGNYAHSHPSSRMTKVNRYYLYDRFIDDPSNTANENWFLQWVEYAPFVVEFTFRDFLIYQFHDDPSLKRHVNLLFNVDAFENITQQCLDACRQSIEYYMNIETPLAKILPEINRIAATYHERILEDSYRLPRSHHDLITTLTILRKVYPVTSTSSTPVTTTAVTEEQETAITLDEDDIGLLLESIHEVDFQNPANLGKAIASAKSDKLINEAGGSEEGDDVSLLLLRAKELVGEDIFETLNKWTRRIAPSKRNVLFDIVSLYPLIGISQALTDAYLELFAEILTGSLNSKKIHAKIKVLIDCNPKAYDILQVTLDLMKHWTKVVLYVKLPSHYLQGQLEAHKQPLHEMYTNFPKETNPDLAVYNTTDFVFCDICFTVYSMLRDFNSPFKCTYRYGYRDPYVDFDTNHLYCTRKKTSHMGTCGIKPLVRISLFGIAIKYGKKTIMMCPLCVAPFVLDTEKCRYVNEGFCCKSCSSVKSDAQWKELAYYDTLEKQEKKCLRCNNVIKSATSAYVYPFGVYLCVRHHSDRLSNAVDEWMHSKEVTVERNAQTMTDFILVSIKEFKSVTHERNKVKWKKQLAMGKLARSTKR